MVSSFIIRVGRKNSRIRIEVLPSHLIRQYIVPSDEDYKTLLIIGTAKVVIIIRNAK